MATADQMKALVRSHAEGDDTKFYSVALQVAARAARGGQSHFAQELRDLVDSLRKQGVRAPDRPIPVTQPLGELSGLLSVSYPETRMADLVLDAAGDAHRRREGRRVADHCQHIGADERLAVDDDAVTRVG